MYKVIHCSSAQKDKILETTQVRGEREVTYIRKKISALAYFGILCKIMAKAFYAPI